MKKIILIAALGLFASNAMAMSRHSSQSMTCAQVHDEISKDGMMVLRYPSKQKSDMMMYSRAVTNSMSCVGMGGMANTTVPTSDDPKCRVKTCNPTTGKGPNKNQ